MTEDYEYIRSFFRKYSGIYDIVVMPLALVRKKVVAMAGVPDGAAVLDVATGTGKQGFAFARKGYNVTGIDLSEDMINIARRKNRFPNVRLEIGDGTALPYESDRFDISCVSFALHDMPLAFREKVLREMARVTRPGGPIFIIDYALPRYWPGRFIIYRAIKSYESKYYPDFINSDLTGLIRESGIKIIEERPVLFGGGRIIRGVKADQ